MLCENCKKNQATIHYQQIVNGEKIELNLCNECAIKMQTGISFDSMFKGFLDSFINMGTNNYNSQNLLSCPTCKMTFEEFKHTGKVGCAKCYETFNKQFSPILKNIQGSTHHTGKIPKKAGSELSTKRQIANLREELKKAVELEEYEKAAKLRDKIKDLERGL